VNGLPGGPLSASEKSAERFTDGEWHRLHPATPLLRGGIFFVAVLGFVLSNLRERIINFFVGAPNYYSGDPIDQIYDRGWEWWALLIVAVVLILAIGAFYLSWRMHTFRITGDAVEVRSGIFFRTQRKARLDRIQGINVVRPLFARIFGAAKLDIAVAGHDANVQLSYLGSALADGLRADVLRLASGVKAAEQEAAGASQGGAGVAGESAGAAGAGAGAVAGAAGAAGLTGGAGVAGAAAGAAGAVSGLVNRRVNEFLAPELDPNAAPPQSVVKIPPLRLLGSLILSGFTIFILIVIVVLIVGASTGRYWLLFVVLPGLIGSASFYINRFTKSLRYSIAGTPDGVRVGFGLLSTSNETLPPGRIHAVEVMQPLMWRPFGWWQIRIDTAGHSKEKGAAGQANTTILPVGDADDAARVLALVLPGFATEEHRAIIAAGMTSRGRDDFIGSPRRARWIRPFSWQRTGYSILDGVILLRRGFIWRSLAIVPLARLQSLEIEQGPIDRMLRLASTRLHTVSGPVRPRLPGVDSDQSVALFDTVSAGAVASAESDRSHRWASVDASAVPGVRVEGPDTPSAPAAPSAAAPSGVGPSGVGPSSAGPSGAGPSSAAQPTAVQSTPATHDTEREGS
jgi:putative membrane protein